MNVFVCSIPRSESPNFLSDIETDSIQRPKILNEDFDRAEHFRKDSRKAHMMSGSIPLLFSLSRLNQRYLDYISIISNGLYNMMPISSQKHKTTFPSSHNANISRYLKRDVISDVNRN